MTTYHTVSNTYREAPEEIMEHGDCKGTVPFSEELCQCLLIDYSHPLHIQTTCAQKLQGESRRKKIPVKHKDESLAMK